MRTFLASIALAAAAAAAAHEGHGEALPVHTHGFDLLGVGLMVAVVAWWLWQRGQR
jgi:hypothetical protein